jgi:hypothetical protein
MRLDLKKRALLNPIKGKSNIMVLYYNVGTSATDGKKSPMFFALGLQEGRCEVRRLLIRAKF